MKKTTLKKILLTIVLGLGMITSFTVQALAFPKSSTHTIAISGGNRTVTYIEIPLDSTYEIRGLTAR